MRKRHSIAWLGLAIGWAVATASAESVRVSGIVVDDRGKPVKDADVGIDWAGQDKSFEAGKSFPTDKAGKFAGFIEVKDKKTPLAFVAFDKGRRNAGFKVVAGDELGEEIRVEIDAAATINGTFDVSDLRKSPDSVIVRVFSTPDKTPLLVSEWAASKKKFAIKLPPGDFEYSLDCEGGERTARKIPGLKPGKTHDLGKLTLVPKVGRGERAAETRTVPKLTVTDARGVAKTVKLSDYKGKWVLLEFWGFW
jgi:hypothetical protein